MTEVVREHVDEIYRADSRRVLATLIRLLGDFDLAEEAMHDAFMAAVEQWPRDGLPANPRAWLVSTGRFKSITAMRKRARFDASLGEIAERLDAAARRSPRTAGQRAARHLSRLQRGLLRFVGGVADPPRSLGRGDPARAPPRRVAAGAGSEWPARADAAARIAARGADLDRGRADPAGRPGPLALESRADRRRMRARRAGAVDAENRSLRAAGGDRGGA